MDIKKSYLSRQHKYIKVLSMKVGLFLMPRFRAFQVL